jgi:hypothetical protein
MRLLKKDEIESSKLIYIKGSDNNLYPLTILEDDYAKELKSLNNYNENKYLPKTEAYYYQALNELYIKEDIVNENNVEITGKINRHMTHAEDLVILSGNDGLKWVIGMFKELYSILKGYTNKEQIKLSIKFDGAPSVFAWDSFPGLEKPGIAIKSLLSKDPKIMYTLEDIDNFYSKEPILVNKLKFLLPYISLLEIPQGEIWQGDFLFDKDSLIREEGYYSFHPNTIVYKVKKDSEVGKKIEKADVGVVWHTRYTGTSLQDIKAQYNTKISELKENSKVFMTDPYIASLAGLITLTKDENKEITIGINNIEEKAKDLYLNTQYKEIIQDKELIDLFKTFQNYLIKQNIHIESKEFFRNFITFVNNKFMKEIESKKTEKGKDTTNETRYNLVNKIKDYEETFIEIITLIIEITKLKNIFIKKLNSVSQFENYLKTTNGRFITTGEEGFAVSDICGNVVKLVDRYEFSKANFSPNILKGWIKNE